MSVLVELSGARVLPVLSEPDVRQTVSLYAAQACLSADLRAKSAPHRVLAGSLKVVPSTRPDQGQGVDS